MDIIHTIATNPELFLILIAALALLVGSFLNVVIHRLPYMLRERWNQECREYLGLKSNPTDIDSLNLHLPFSHCPQCKKTLKPWHNIPVLSFLVLKGHCAYCHGRISLRYPFVEILSCITSVYIALHFGFTWQTAGALIFTWISIALIFIDLDHHLLPDQLTLLLLWVGLLLSIFSIFTNSTDAIIGAIAGYLIFAVIQGLFKFATGKIGMGQGDYKYLAALGAFLGYQQLPVVILLASVSGLIFGLTHMLLIKRHFKSVPLPFGPYLAVAGWISLLWGQDILLWYTHKFFM